MAGRRSFATACLALLVLLFGSRLTAQQPDTGPESGSSMGRLSWQVGPATGDLGGIATIAIPAGYRFVGRAGTARFLELTQNPTSGNELGVLVGGEESSWFVVFSFSDEGYVKDDERDLDADGILSSIREGTEAANKIRLQRGWTTLEVVGWQEQPFYDPETNNLTWATIARSEGSTSVNRSTRLLGRRGVMNADLVLAPEDLLDAVPAFKAVLTGFSFNSGHKYAEFTKGDKVAQYGLAGLIVGGAGVTLAKTGLLKKFGKLIVVGFVAIGSFIARLFRRRPE